MVNTEMKVFRLKLDLANFRTVHQPDEERAVNALIAIHPDWFWGLMESLIEDGYSPTENIIVLKSNKSFIVKEGNRRIASLKLIHGLVSNIDLPDHIEILIDNISDEWKRANSSVPCAVYPHKSASTVERIVSRTHAKGESSGRDKWTSVARARFARDKNGKPESGLDILETYLEVGKNRTPAQAERWAGEYPLTVLDDAIKKLAPLVDLKTAKELAAHYPKKNKRLLDRILFDIGTSHLGFKQLRAKAAFWGAEYKLPHPKTEKKDSDVSGGEGSASGTSGESKTGEKEPNAKESAQEGKQAKVASAPSNTPRAVKDILERFQIRGNGREKIVTLVQEMKKLNINSTPHAFCFLLRSTFELSAKAYCDDHKRDGGPSLKKKDGRDKSLKDLLRDITKHLTKSEKDKDAVKRLHGAMTEIAKSNGVLSVTSMNQLVHNRSFSVIPSDICLLFGNLFPLLQEMNG